MLRQPVRSSPLMRDLSWEKRGDQSGAALPYLLTEVSLKAAPAASILATKAQLHRLVAHRSASKKGNRQLVPNHYRNALAKNEVFPLRKKHAAIPARKERSGLREAPEKAPTAP